MVIDLRSDTVTRPTPDMLAAMAAADTGDDVYGEDPTVRVLQERVAGLLGHEAGLFTVTGSMANVLGVRAHVRPGAEVLCEAQAHIVRAELGAHAVTQGVTTRTWSHPQGRIDFDVLHRLVAPPSPYFVATAAIEVENTHNFAGGVVQPLQDLQKLRSLADRAGLRVHLDGARLWNAHVAAAVPLDTYGRLADTVSVCFSKGLGAPVGSLLAGPSDVIAEAREWRRRLGGGWRQAGVLAAAAQYAVDKHVERLADDHVNARIIAETVAAVADGVVDPAAVQTNIVVLDVGERAADVVGAAHDQGVLVGLAGPGVIRAVTHLDVSSTQARAAADILADLISGHLAR